MVQDKQEVQNRYNICHQLRVLVCVNHKVKRNKIKLILFKIWSLIYKSSNTAISQSLSWVYLHIFSLPNLEDKAQFTMLDPDLHQLKPIYIFVTHFLLTR